MTMTCYDDGEVASPRPVSPTAKPTNWRGGAVVLTVFVGLLALLWFATGCSPLRGPATSTARPEATLATIPAATEAATAELATVCTSTTAIRQEVAAMVPSVREAKAVAPAPVARIEAGHQAIYGAAQAAEAAAGQAKAQVETITASASQTEKELAGLRQEIESERAAWAKERAEWQEREDSSLRALARWGQVAGGLCMAAGVALLFVLRGAVALPVGLLAAGGVLLALSSLLYKWAAYVPYIGLAMLLAVAGAAAWLLRQRQAREALLSDAVAGAVGFGEKLKAAAPVEAVEAAKDWAKLNLNKATRDELWLHLPTERDRR